MPELPNSIVQYLIFAVILAAVVGVEHMAFRTPQWKARELARRAIGDGTVLILFALIVVVPGAADWLTWVMLAGGFVITGVVKIALQWSDDRKLAALMEQFNDNREEEGAD